MASSPVRRVSLVAALAMAPLAVAAQEPGARSQPQVVSSDTAFFAEGLAADPRDGTLFVTSIHWRNVLVVAPDGRTRWLLAERDADGVGAIFGAVFDAEGARLWLTAAPLAMMAARGPGDRELRAELLEVQVADGRILRRWALGSGDGMPGEIARAGDGSILVSDGLRGQLYRLRSGATSIETLRDAALRSPQGIAPTPDGAVAYVADWSRGLLRWDLRSDSIVSVPTADGRLLRGVDGLRWHAGSLIGVQNGASPNRVVRIHLDAAGRAIAGLDVVDAPAALEGEMTVAVLLGDELVYVASSGWPFWTEDGQRRTDGRALPPVVLRRLRLR